MAGPFVRKQPEPDPDRRDRGGELSEKELAGEVGQVLPDRAALSILDADVSIPLNPAVAADVLSGDDDAEQPSDDDEPL